MNNSQEDTMEPDLTDRLALRLSALDIPVPAALVPRVLATSKGGTQPAQRRRRRLMSAVAALVVPIAGNFGASYFSPRYAQALADVPGAGVLTGPILQQAGLATTAGAQPLESRVHRDDDRRSRPGAAASRSGG